MKLSQTVSFFGNVTCQDAWGTYSFVGSLDTSKKPMRDMVVALRRVLTVEPGTIRPPRNTVLMDGVPYIIGDAFPDYWFGNMIRDNWEIQKCDGIATVSTFAQAIAGHGGTTMYVSKAWQKAVKDAAENSFTFNDVYFYVGANESVLANSIIQLYGVNYLVQNDFLADSGFVVAHAQELAEPSITFVSLQTKVYHPVADVWTSATSSIAAIILRWQDGFRYLSQSSVQYHRGDLQVIVRKADAAPTNGSTITIAGMDYTVLAQLDEGNCLSLHVRLA